MSYIAIDLEFNQPYNFSENFKTVLVENCPCEIVQIGAVKMNGNLEITDTKDYLIKPQLYTKIHPYVEKITGISESMLMQQPTFPEIYEELLDFLEMGKSIICVWGNSDIKELSRNILYYGLNDRHMPHKFVNVQQLASTYLKQPSGMCIGLKNAVDKLELSMDEIFHNALNDAVYTARIFKQVYKPNIQIRNFKVSEFMPEEKHERKPLKSVDAEALYGAIEKELGRRLSRKEKMLMKKVYSMGKAKSFG